MYNQYCDMCPTSTVGQYYLGSRGCPAGTSYVPPADQADMIALGFREVVPDCFSLPGANYYSYPTYPSYYPYYPSYYYSGTYPWWRGTNWWWGGGWPRGGGWRGGWRGGRGGGWRGGRGGGGRGGRGGGRRT